jgi:PRELI-like family
VRACVWVSRGYGPDLYELSRLRVCILSPSCDRPDGHGGENRQTDHSPWYPDSAPFYLVVLAHLLRYPNPYTRHVLTSDVVDRRFDPVTQTLSTVRLLLKTGSLPRWAPRGLVNRSEVWIIEVSEVDLVKGFMRSRTMNLEHRGIMEVVESVTVRGARSEVEANIKSDWRGFGLLRGRIEAFGVKRFANSVERVRRTPCIRLPLPLLHFSSASLLTAVRTVTKGYSGGPRSAAD